MANELEELIRKAQELPGVADVIEVERMYNKLLLQSGLRLGVNTPDAFGSYSFDTS